MRTRAIQLTVMAAALVLTVNRAEAETSRCEPTDQRRTANVVVMADAKIAGAKVMVDYPEGQVGVPGSRDDEAVKARIGRIPQGFDSLPNDFEHALRIVLASGTQTIPERAFTIEFDVCKDAGAITAKNFACTVEQAAGPTGELIEGARCSVELQ